MFTGIIAETGVVESITGGDKSNPIGLTVRCKLAQVGLKVGDSVAVNGCCLTVVQISSRQRLIRCPRRHTGNRDQANQ